MIYLIEMEPVVEATGVPVTLRYGSAGFTTEPTDAPANAEFEPRVSDPGNYERFLFARGATRGESTVGGGDIVLINADHALDWLLDLAFDGRPVRIYGLADIDTPWADRETVFVGTMEQATFAGRQVEIRIRDRLDLLRETVQTERFKGTTTSGDAVDAEGNVDLKDVLVPELFGSQRFIAPILVDAWGFVYRAARRLDGVTAVRDLGVDLKFEANFADVAALKAATIRPGFYATCLALGLVRVQMRPASLTVDAFTGATVEDRSAARIVRRLIPAGLPVNEVDFLALHVANPAECGFLTGTAETTVLAVAMAFMNTVGASLNVDRFGTFRTRRLERPVGAGKLVLDETIMLDRGEGFSRNAPNDQGDGVQARSVTVRYGRSPTVYTENDLRPVDDNVSEDVRSYVMQEWRQEVVKSERNALLHPKGPELVFDTCFVHQADARREAERLGGVYFVRSDFFTIHASSDLVATADLGDIETLLIERFDFAAGRPVVVTGLVQTYKTNTTEIEVWR